jgi:hypothetical protein
VEEEESSNLLQLCCSSNLLQLCCSLNLQHLLSFESALVQLFCSCCSSVAALLQQLWSFPRSCLAHLLTIEQLARTLVALRPHTLVALRPHTLVALRPHTLVALRPHTLVALRPHTLVALRPHTLVAYGPIHW